MSEKEEKLSTDLGEAAELAIAEHLKMLKMAAPPQDIEMQHPQTGELATVPNPLWIKVMALKNRAASDVLNIMRSVDPQSMKGRKTDRTRKILDRVMGWEGPKENTTKQ